MDASGLPGWFWNGERLVADDTVDGCIARRAEVRARCQGRDCTRRVVIDLRAWSSLGFGRAPIQEVRTLYGCGRKPRCEMSWWQEYPQGLPLQSYVGDPNVELEVRCEACGHARRFGAQAVIQRLAREGLGDGNTGVIEAAKRIRGSCRCRARRWRIEIIRGLNMGLGT